MKNEKLKMQNDKSELNRKAIYTEFNNLKNFLIYNLCFHGKKYKIINDVPRGKGQEGYFVRKYLSPCVKSYFEHLAIDIIFEGMNSAGETQFKNKFFGSKPAPDFIFKSITGCLFGNSPFPLDTVGEVKYEKLTFQKFAGGLGQIVSYLESSKAEKFSKGYGYYIFFNLATIYHNEISKNELDFLHQIWQKHRVFTVII